MITLFNDPFFTVFDEVMDSTISRTPQINVRKNEKEYRILIAVPGLSKDDIKIITKDSYITISYKKEEKNDTIYFVNSFQKTYKIPDEVNETGINGKVENGVLELLLPFEKKKNSERSISLH
jgi:HSP20 family protein